MTTITPDRAAPTDAREPGGQAPVPVSGILDVTGREAFLRTSGYRLGREDAYVPMSLVGQAGLRKGDLVAGAARPPGAGGGGRPPRRGQAQDTRRVLVRVDAINEMAPSQARRRPGFDELTPVYPQERLRLDAGSPSPTARIVDLVSPVGKGQRGLIVAAPKAGKTTVLKAIAVDDLRRALAGLDPQQALELLLGKTRETSSNLEFLLQVQRSARPRPATARPAGRRP